MGFPPWPNPTIALRRDRPVASGVDEARELRKLGTPPSRTNHVNALYSDLETSWRYIEVIRPIIFCELANSY